MNTKNKEQNWETRSDELWDVRLNGKKLKSSMMRTYSKKTPYVLLSAAKKYDEEGALLSKSEQETWDHVLRNTPRKNNLKKSITRKFSKLVDSCKKKNKTSVSLASMSPCTVLNFTDAEDDVDVQPMSLCSIGTAGGKIPAVKTRNSTLLTNSNDVDSNFVPNDISVIEGDDHNVHQTMNDDEWSMISPGLESGPSVKKVKFSVGRIGKKAKVNYHKPVGTPARSILKVPLQPLLSDSDEKSPEFNADITPETCNPVKTYSGSAKQRRRLSYHPADDVPACIFLDLPVSKKKKKKAQVLCRKTPDLIQPQDLNSFQTDILL